MEIISNGWSKKQLKDLGIATSINEWKSCFRTGWFFK